ncbi:hypothetical protein DM558_00315 [Entomomonas moraniae]|uniref:Uncharacterized protein n=1 Tax=Entomomonas moraniae TaxID=2213226 RepID=A0A3Q9JL91_9GAMM|nr:hypothetical protein [Entomomonas moraniae]AZS49313.1 hypothetical protein DM558_00315 [Entomomonas moraniae]
MLRKLAYWMLRNSVIIELTNDSNQVVINSNLKKIDPLTITPAEAKAFLWLQESRLDNNVKQINVKG